jgi:hypothetical protein
MCWNQYNNIEMNAGEALQLSHHTGQLQLKHKNTEQGLSHRIKENIKNCKDSN